MLNGIYVYYMGSGKEYDFSHLNSYVNNKEIKKKNVAHTWSLTRTEDIACHTQRPMNRIFLLKLCNYVSS